MNDYGKRVWNALRAVQLMHSDASKLLLECDDEFSNGKPSIFGSYATRDLTWSVRATQYMAEGLYRYYDPASDQPGIVQGITITFIGDGVPNDVDQPTIIVGRIKYHDRGLPVKEMVDEWDLWHAYFDWHEQHDFDKELVPVPKSKNANRIEWIRLVAKPLYEIKKTIDVVNLMERLRVLGPVQPNSEASK